MSEYTLEEDKLIGHELVIHRRGLFRRELFLRDVYYNDLIRTLDVDKNKTVIWEIEWKKELNFVNNYTLRHGGDVIGKSRLEKRIRSLQFRFIDLYLTRAKEILEKNCE